MTDITASEWLKLRTLNAAPIALGVLLLAVAGAALLAWYAAHAWDGMSGTDHDHFAVAPVEPLIAMVADLCCGVVAALAVTSEHASGMIVPTLVAVPDRRRLLAAKALVVAATSTVAGTVSIVGGSIAARLLVGARPIHPMTDAVSRAPALLSADCLLVTVTALVAMALGVLLRSTAGTVASLVALIYVVPMFTQALPAPWSTRVSSLTLGALPGELAGVGNPHSVYGASLAPYAAGLATVAYAVVALGAAAVQFRHRDI